MYRSKANGRFDCQAYRERNVVERRIDRLRQHRRVASRHEKRTANYRAMLSEHVTQGGDCRSSFGVDAMRQLIVWQKL